MLGTIGFDLDMTLVDSRIGIAASMHALSAETGRPIDVPLVLSRLGPRLEWELANWFPAHEVDTAAVRYREIYFEECVLGTTAFDGARLAIDTVRDRGGSVIVVTTKSAALAKRCLEHVDLAYDTLVGDVHGDGKADALRAHGARAYVGDMVTDVASALAANAIAVAVTTGGASADELRDAGAHIVVNSMTEVASWLTTLA